MKVLTLKGLSTLVQNISNILQQKQDVIEDLQLIRLGSQLGATSLQEHQDITNKADKATTLEGYGIEDTYTKTELDETLGEFFDEIDQMEIKQRLIDGVQAHMDKLAKTRGYDGILSACTYNDTLNEKFDTEGRQMRIWRSAVWDFCYASLDDVLAGLKPIPTLEELIEELPRFEWKTQ